MRAAERRQESGTKGRCAPSEIDGGSSSAELEKIIKSGAAHIVANADKIRAERAVSMINPKSEKRAAVLQSERGRTSERRKSSAAQRLHADRSA